jgi:P pilus assembly chaperone PapD
MKKFLLLSGLSAFVFLSFVPQANAIRLTVKRVLFEGPKRAENIVIINDSEEPKTYRVGWRHFVMTEEKTMKAVPEEQVTAEMKPAKDMIRFSPRRFTVPAKSSQNVRMMLRMPGGLPDGEYRSHLWIRPEAEVQELNLQNQQAPKPQSGKSGVMLQMLTGVTMPIIVRKGNLTAQTSLSELAASQSPGHVRTTFTLNRSGERSIYGNLDYICNQGAGNEYIIHYAKGIAVYAETNRRNFDERLIKEPDEPACNTLTVRFTEAKEFAGSGGPLVAEQTTAVR